MSEVPRIDRVEILVHITAPSGLQDDLRYHAQAAAIAEFAPVSRVKVYGPEVYLEELQRDSEVLCADDEDSTFHTSFSFSAWHQTEQIVAITETPAQNLTRHLLKENNGEGVTDSLARRQTQCGQHTQSSTRSFKWKITKSQPTDHNPPFKKPSFHGRVASPTIHAYRTPETRRPKTAPTSSTVIKLTIPRKRAWSESSSFESLGSVIPDSQEQPASAASQALLYPVAFTASNSNSIADSTARTIVPEQPLDRQTRAAKRQRPNPATNAGQKSGTPNVAPILGTSPQPVSQAQSKRRVMGEPTKRPPMSSSSTSIWPPKPRANIYYPPSPERGHYVNARTMALQDTPAPAPEAEFIDFWRFSQSSPPAAITQSVSLETFQQVHTSISSLPSAIHAPTPPVGLASYTTHLTPSLRTLTTQLPIDTSFRPVHVARDVNVLERGYWHFRITVLRDTSSHQPDEPAPLSKENVWTEEAFISFWNAIATSVQSGDVGWGVSIYLQDLGPESSQSSQPACQNDEEMVRRVTKDVILKVTCWGEIVPHIYLLMWVMSDKKTTGLGMEWRDAREEGVIRMSRKGAREGKLSLYGFKGGEGVDRRWGIIRAKR